MTTDTRDEIMYGNAPPPERDLTPGESALLHALRQMENWDHWLLFVNAGFTMDDAKGLQELGLIETSRQLGMPAARLFAVTRMRDATSERREELKRAFVAGACAVLTWTNAGMPQDDLDEAGYDYAANALSDDGRVKPLGTDDAENGCPP